MRYIISDIHGCYNEYRELLEKIGFSDEDELYILGDVVDRGPEPIMVLQDIMHRSNVTLILGNHDLMMYLVMKKMTVVITEENRENHLSADDLLDYQLWMQDGGQITASKFREISMDEKLDILDYLSEASLYEILEQEEKKYILVHAGLGDFSPEKELEDYELHELLEERADYSKRYYPDENTYLVTGHTPTVFIKGWGKTEVYRKNGHIAIDCGCVAGGKLAAFCVETGQITYADGR